MVTFRILPLFITLCFSYVSISCTTIPVSIVPAQQDNYNSLVALFQDWREFEQPPLLDGAPDYRKETFIKRQDDFSALQTRFESIDTSSWSVSEKVDWYILRAEMNGYDFNLRILRPWERDPAYYKCLWTYRSDVPAHEGPTNHGTTEIWMYDFPLTEEREKDLIRDLSVIPPFYDQAKINLTGNAKDLWIAGIRDIKRQSGGLKDILKEEGVRESTSVVKAINEAILATESLASWLEKEASNKTGPSGIGKDNYTWYLKMKL